MLNITSLTKSFSQNAATHRVTFDVPISAMIGMIGRSGAGKSTLLRMMNGLTIATSGQIVFEEQTATGLTGAALRGWQAQCAMIFQQFNLVRH